MATEHEELLRYYRQELTYLKEMGELFAERHPKVARRLSLGPDGSTDPHVERLLEGFALLAGRLQHRLDDDFPEIAGELLNLLYPHYLAPIPPMTIARFETDPTRGKVTAGQEVPVGTEVFAQQAGGAVCRFRTCYPVTLWPLVVTEASFEPPQRWEGSAFDGAATVLRLRLEAREVGLQELELEDLRIHLHGDSQQVHSLWERLFGHLVGVAVVDDPPPLPGGPARMLRDAEGELIVPKEVGFEVDDEVIPYPRHSHPAYRLLQEYFLFPEKFHFFDVGGLGAVRGEQAFDLLFLLDSRPRTRMRLDPQTFCLGCTPVVNLFERVSEPIRVDQTRFEYRLVADHHRERSTEIHSVRFVTATTERDEPLRRIASFYAFDHELEERGQGAFWHARRVPTRRADLAGTDMLLSFVDLDFEPLRPAADVVFAHCLYTNRDLALQVPAGARLQCDLPGLAVPIEALHPPTPPLWPPRDGQTLWRLVSHLSLSYLTLSSGSEALASLKEILRLYGLIESPATQRQVGGIREMEVRPVVRRFGPQAWTGFCRGNEVALTFDPDNYTGSSPLLLAAVLSRFFALHASVNSFTELVARRTDRKGDWKRWSPRAGERSLL